MLTLFRRYDTLFLPVALVANEDLVYSFRRMLFYVRKPRSNVYIVLVPYTTYVEEHSDAEPCARMADCDLLSKLLRSVTSYTRRIPMAPL